VKPFRDDAGLDDDGQADLRYACAPFYGAAPVVVYCDRELSLRDVEVG